MKMIRPILCVAGSLMLSVLSAKAHPYAAAVKVTGGTTVSFRLNETVTNGVVAYLFDNGTVSNYVGGTLASPVTNGLYSFSLAGHTNFAVYVFNLGDGIPHQISPNPGTGAGQSPLVDFFGPRCAAVNRNPNSPYFGTIYVANAAPGGDTVRTVGQGVYALNADFSDAFGYGATAMPPTGTGAGQIRFGNSTTYGVYSVFVGKDDVVYIGDASGGDSAGTTVGGGVWMATPNLTSATDLFPFNGNIGGSQQVCSAGVPFAEGSYAAGDLTLYTIEWNRAPYQNVWQYQFFTNSNTPLPLPWNLSVQPNSLTSSQSCPNVYPAFYTDNNPNTSVNAGISSVNEVGCDLWVGPDGRFYCCEPRSSAGQQSLWIYDNVTNGNCLLWDDYDVNNDTSAAFWGSEAVCVSDDNLFIASSTVSSDTGYGSPAGYILWTTLSAQNPNGVGGMPSVPPNSIIYNPAVATTIRGVAFDKADNLYGVSGSEDSLRAFSLGLTTTCITSNDFTGTNGGFSIVIPAITASVVATTPVASQNHGSPIPGVFTITLSTNYLAQPVTLNFSFVGTATNGTYIASATNTIVIPAGTTSASGNISTNITITPTAIPVVGPTVTVTLKLGGGSGVIAVAPVQDTVYIANTGPQTLTITSVPGPTMYRGNTNDYLTFIVTRLGDTNAAAYTVTNLTYSGTAVLGVDYLAGLQPAPQSPTATLIPGKPAPGFTVSQGQVNFTNIVGEPVPTPYGASPVGNKTVIISLGAVTNQTSMEDVSYIVSTNTTSMTEIDNANPPEVVLWSDALTNAAATNWNLSFANSNLGPATMPPVYITNYTNIGPAGSAGNPDSAGTNDYDVEFGYSVANDAVGQSLAMAAKGWTSALKVSVNKDPNFDVSSGVNLFPTGVSVSGNYALRFSMNLSEGFHNPIEYALFGVNVYGTNCDWVQLDPNVNTVASYHGANGVPQNGGGNTNNDGVWYSMGADNAGALVGYGYPDMANYTGAPPPNSGSTEQLSSTANVFAGVFKHPIPFTATGVGTPADGNQLPANTWCDVEINQLSSGGSNVVTLLINKTVIFSLTNTTVFTNGTIMLGYDDPLPDVGATAVPDLFPGAAVYYSNVRIVESGPMITTQPLSLTVSAGQPVTFNVAATGVGPFTNLWYFNTSTLVSSNTVASSPDTNSLVIPSATVANSGTYFVTITDASGTSVSSVPVTLTVVAPSSPNITGFGLDAADASAVLHFTSTDQFDTTNSYNLQVSTNLDNPVNAGFMDVSGAVFTETSGVFTVTIPTNGIDTFYRLEHK
ncbi:MAG TPA: immunoglobulin domain-containing protein [Verrucomicrobiae bacterium]|nr:immunoglobulin domain-containing protein [Verrucomicrobiae bacterium]